MSEGPIPQPADGQVLVRTYDGAVEPRLFNQPLTFGGTPGSTDDKAPLILAI